MTYVIVKAGQIVGPEIYGLPAAAARLDTGAWVTPPDRAWTPDLLAACGIVAVTVTARPADTATTTSDRSLTVVAGVPTETWTPRPWTTDELTARTVAGDETTLRDRATSALATNTTYLALATPTNAQVVAQVKALTQQVNALIRLAVRALDSTA